MMKSIYYETAICNIITQQNLYIFHPLSYKYTTCFDLIPSWATLIQKYSHEDGIQHMYRGKLWKLWNIPYLILSILLLLVSVCLNEQNIHGRIMFQAIISREGPCSIPGQEMWNLCQAKCKSISIPPSTLLFPCNYHSTSAPYR